jgi:hypothetical protein
MYQPAGDRQRDAAAARALGWELEEASGPPPIEVWPDTLQSVLVFDALGSQWTYAGAGGVPTGIVYASVEPVLRVRNVPAEDWPQVFEDIREMESAALEEMWRQHEKRNKK